MPIDKDTFNIAKDPGLLILNFLRVEPEKAFSSDEIWTTIKLFDELMIPERKIRDTLDVLVRTRQIEVAWVKGNAYYMIKRRI